MILVRQVARHPVVSRRASTHSKELLGPNENTKT